MSKATDWPGLRRINLAFVGVSIASVSIAIVALVYLPPFADALWRDPSRRHLIALLFLWQTQVGAVLALIAAIAGALIVLQQTRATELIEQERRRRKMQALRAAAPVALVDYHGYAKECANKLAGLMQLPADKAIVFPGLSLPELPIKHFSTFTELIENCPNDHARPFTVFLRRLQIHQSRMQDANLRAASAGSELLVQSNVSSYLIHSAEIYARCDNLLVYARTDTEAPPEPLSFDSIRSILVLLGSWLPQLDELIAEAKRYADKGGWPEN